MIEEYQTNYVEEFFEECLTLEDHRFIRGKELLTTFDYWVFRSHHYTNSIPLADMRRLVDDSFESIRIIDMPDTEDFVVLGLTYTIADADLCSAEKILAAKARANNSPNTVTH